MLPGTSFDINELSWSIHLYIYIYPHIPCIYIYMYVYIYILNEHGIYGMSPRIIVL